MSTNKFFYKFPLIQTSLVMLLFLSCSLVFYILYCDRKSKVEVSYTQSISSVPNINNEVYIIFSIPQDKQWRQPDKSWGAQYDGKFTNTTHHTFTDWTVTAKVPKGYWVDSCWNADFYFYFNSKKPIPDSHKDSPEFKHQYKSDTNEIVMKKVPGKQSTEIPGKKHEKDYDPFMVGMILYTPVKFQVEQLTITGRFIYKPTESFLFYFLLFAILVDVILFVIFCSIQISVIKRIRFYELRQKLDSDIIVQSFKTFANFVDAKDPYTKGHSLRVAHYAREIARRLNMTEHEQMEIFWEGLMHDVGKISIRDNILNKPSKLNDEEFLEIQSHTSKGYAMLNDFDAMPMLKEVAKSHHEHWDGSGYCEHLKGQEIPLEARIVCVSDSFDAMNSDRCYRKRLSKEQIIEEFSKKAGSHFDPKIAKIMISMIQQGFTSRIENIDTLNDINYKA